MASSYYVEHDAEHINLCADTDADAERQVKALSHAGRLVGTYFSLYRRPSIEPPRGGHRPKYGRIDTFISTILP